jgi:hypothetical protein
MDLKAMELGTDSATSVPAAALLQLRVSRQLFPSACAYLRAPKVLILVLVVRGLSRFGDIRDWEGEAGAKSPISFSSFCARLKSCPDTKPKPSVARPHQSLQILDIHECSETIFISPVSSPFKEIAILLLTVE